MERDYRFGYGGQIHDGGFRRDLRKRRPVIDYGSTMVQWLREGSSFWHRRAALMGVERPSQSYIVTMPSPMASPHSASESIPSKYLHESTNKVKHSVNTVQWTPDGRRLLAGSSSGEFTLWNGNAFNFETIMQAHYGAVRATAWSHGEEWLISSDSNGTVKYWQPNFNNVKQIDKLHTDDIRDLAFSPNDSKFVTACDDAVLKIVDFASSLPESSLIGHNWDVKTVDWHPTKSLLASGSKDHQIKFWDPRTGRCLTTLHGHKNTVSKVAFEPRKGQLLATCARDHTARIFDIRMMRDICLLRGHEKDISTLIWHPFHANLLSTGGSDGSLFHYLLNEPHTPGGVASNLPPYDSPDPNNSSAQIIHPAHRIQYAHEEPIWSLNWHPLGHILASGSNDRCTRFWSRARPGETDCFGDRYHLGRAAAEVQGTWDRRDGRRIMREEEEQDMDDEADGLVDQQMPAQQLTIPSIPGLTMNAVNAKASTGSNASSFQLPPFPPNLIPNGMSSSKNMAGMDRDKFDTMIREGKLVIPPPFGASGPGLIPPPPLPPNFDYSKLPPGTFPPPVFGANGQPLVPTSPTHTQSLENLPISISIARLPGLGSESSGSGSVRRRAPLPSQQESLAEEQRKGKYRVAR